MVLALHGKIDDKGYATEAILGYSKFFIPNYDIKKIIATDREANIPSWKAIKKAGYKLTGKNV